MELRRVDPRIVKNNPRNPRKIQPGEMSDAALAASIGAIGILQPPVVSEKNGELTIAYGARRVRIAIAIGLPEIDVLVKDPDDHDHMRSVSENVVRAPMATVDLWRSIESLASENWTEEAIASASRFPCARSASSVCWRTSTPLFSIRSARATCRENRICARSPWRRATTRPRYGRS